uniref:Mitochondrial carrier protein n=1 Tax=viral metagenome TaxID=1070528 RepID=A0A6C0AD58_9ZZZZ
MSNTTSPFDKALVGVVSQSITWPFEYIKTVQQFKEVNSTTQFIKNRINKKGIGNELRNIYQSMIPQALIAIPRFITRFTIYENLIKLNNNNQTHKFMSGIIAGGVEGFLIMTPAEVIKTSVIKRNSGLANNLTQIYNGNGLIGFWKGAYSTMLRQSTTQGVSLYSNSLLNPILKNHLGNYTGMISGIVSGVLAVSINNPIDVIKTRQQEVFTKQSSITIAKDIFKQEGLKGFYKGYCFRCMKVAPLHGITYFVYDLLKS